MATSVQIAVTLDANNVVTGVKNVNSSLDSIPNHAKPAFDKVNKSQLKTRETIDQLAYSLGVNVPGAVTKAIASFPALASALGVLGDAAGITALVVGLTETATHIDEVRAKVGSLGQDIDDVGQRIYRFFSGKGYTAGNIGQQIQKQTEDQILAPFADTINQLAQKTSTAGLQGAAAIKAQADAEIAALSDARNKLVEATNAKYQPPNGDINPIAQQVEIQSLRDYAVGVQEIEKQRDAQLLALRNQTNQQLLAMDNQANEAGLTGLQLILQKEVDAVKLKNSELKTAGQNFAIPKADADIQKLTQAQIDQASHQWADGTRQLEDQIARQGLGGVAAINAQIQSEIDTQIEAFKNAWGNNPPFPDPKDDAQRQIQSDWLLAAQELQDRLSAIYQGGERQRAEFEQQITDEIIAEQSKAAVASLPPWQRANAQAVADYQARVRQIQEEKQKEGLSDKQAADLMTAAWSEANAEIVENMRQTRDELASQLESVFDDITSGNIGQAILGQIKHFFAEIVAQWILSMNQMKSDTQGNSLGVGSIIRSQGGGGLLGSLLGGLFHIGSGSSTSTPNSTGTSPTPNSLGTSSSLLSTIAPALAIGGAVAAPLALGAFTGASDISGLSNPFGMPAGTGLVNGLSNPFGSAASLSAGNGTASLANQQHQQAKLANTVGGSILEDFFSKHLTHGISLGKFSLSGTQTGFLGGSVALESILGAYSSANSTLGIAGSAAGGALAGFSYGGPVGAVVCGIAGGIAGLFSAVAGGRHKENEAIDAVNNTYTPAISQIVQQYKQFQTQYQDAINGLNDLQNQAHQQLHQIGGPADDIYKQALVPEITQAESSINTIETERDRRAAITFAPAQFASGGTIPGFGPVPIIGHGQEEVIRMPYAAQNRDLLQYINAGGRIGGSSTVTHNHFHITAHDAKSFEEYVKQPRNARAIRNAVRLDQLRYSGGHGLV